MEFVLELIREYGFGIVFLNVLIEQLGAPIPAYPVLIVTGALEGASWARLLGLTGVAVLAALVADVLWYHAGKAYGHRVLGQICRISLSPDACIRQTESVYGRWGAKSLLVAKFIPGFASIASALAGVVGTPLLTFVLFDLLGALIWVGSAVYLGSLFSSTVQDLLDVLTTLGQWGLVLVLLVFTVFVVRKWWQRQRVRRAIRMPRMTVQELADLVQQGRMPTVIDVRDSALFDLAHIPGAQSWQAVHAAGGPLSHLQSPQAHPHGLVLYCDCPNDVSAAQVASQLHRAGFRNARPLAGGWSAWEAAGLAVENPSAAQGGKVKHAKDAEAGPSTTSTP